MDYIEKRYIYFLHIPILNGVFSTVLHNKIMLLPLLFLGQSFIPTVPEIDFWFAEFINWKFKEHIYCINLWSPVLPHPQHVAIAYRLQQKRLSASWASSLQKNSFLKIDFLEVTWTVWTIKASYLQIQPVNCQH